jgi:hypothetical protein
MTTAIEQGHGAAHVPRRFPGHEAQKGDILGYRDNWFKRQTYYRARHMQRMSIDLWFWLGKQWIESDLVLVPTGSSSFRIKEQGAMTDAYGIELPKPVTNYVAPAVEVETAALGKRQWVPTVTPTDADPRVQEAARKAKEILESRLGATDWATMRDEHIFYMVACGTAIMKSWFDESYLDIIKLASPEAVSCSNPSCGLVLSSPVIPTDVFQAFGGNKTGATEASDVEKPMEGLKTRLENCPRCAEPTPLLRYDVSEEEAEGGSDVIGRALGYDQPRGETSLETVMFSDFYPENDGLGVTPLSLKRVGQRSVRSLDWIEEHYPTAKGVAPVQAGELLEGHPLFGAFGRLSPLSAAFTPDVNVYPNHAFVEEMVSKPTMNDPKGSYIVTCGDVILEQSPLLREREIGGKKACVPRVYYGVSTWKSRPGELWGQSLIDDVRPIQTRINGMDAQIIETRARMGQPQLAVPADIQLDEPEWTAAIGQKIMRYTRSYVSPEDKPFLLGGAEMASGTWQERDRALQDLQKVAGPQEVELGEAPRNITTTTGLQLLGENAERRRAQRERSLVTTCEKIWNHVLNLEWVLRVEPGYYELTHDDGTVKQEPYVGEDIAGQLRVKVEKQAYIDKSIFQREAVREAQSDGLIVIDTPLARRRALELRGLPTNVNDDTNKQIDAANEQWIAFLDTNKVPTIDTTLDDPYVHYMTLGSLMLTPEGKERAKTAGWEQVVGPISGWEQDLQSAMQAEAAVIQVYGARLPKQQAQEAYARLTLAYQAQEDAQQQEMAAAQQAIAAGQQAPPPQPLGPPPPEPNFLPPSMPEKVEMVWRQRLTEVGLQPESFPDGGAYFRFRAVYDAYKLLASGGGAAPSPGSGSTSAPGDQGTPLGGVPPAGSGNPPGAAAQQAAGGMPVMG